MVGPIFLVEQENKMKLAAHWHRSRTSDKICKSISIIQVLQYIRQERVHSYNVHPFFEITLEVSKVPLLRCSLFTYILPITTSMVYLSSFLAEVGEMDSR